MINVNDITSCKTNEETMIGLIPVKSKNNNKNILGKVIKGNTKIGENN